MYTLPKLPFAFNALEPHIDAKTMEVHYTKHHQAYCDNTNKALAGTAWEGKPIEEVLMHLQEVPEDTRMAVRNHGGGYANHNLFWTLMTPTRTEPHGDVEKAINDSFGSIQDFKVKFSEKATLQFGSGWAWLAVKDGKLELLNLPNQDTPLSQGMTPVMALDVWEHAYYLQYQNRRPEYVAAWWNVVNWDEVERRYGEAVQ